MIAQTKILKPAILPDDKRNLTYPLIFAIITSALLLIIFKHIAAAIVPWIIILVFPGMMMFFHLIFHLFVKVQISDDKLVIIDYLRNSIVQFPVSQEMHYSEIAYVYYLDQEINILKALRSKMKKYKLAKKETDYTKENLTKKHGITEEDFDSFKRNSQKTINDFTATGVLMKLDEIYAKYHVSKIDRKSIKQGLGQDKNYNFDYLRSMLASYPVSENDLSELQDELSETNTDVLEPFLRTNVNVSDYMKIEQGRAMVALARVDASIVISNHDGTKKIYFVHFHDLSLKDCRCFMATLKEKNSDIRFLMNKRSREVLLGE